VYTRCHNCGADIRDPGRDFICPMCRSVVRSMGGGFVDDEEAMGPIASIALSDEPRWKAVVMTLQRLARLAAILCFGLALALCFGALFWGAPLFFQNAPSSGVVDSLFLLTPAPVSIVPLAGWAFIAYYVFLVCAIVASGAFLVHKEKGRILGGIGKALSTLQPPDRKDTSSGLVQLPQIFLAVFFFDYVYAIIVILTGTSPRVPAFQSLPDWYQFYIFARASVWEEVAARTLLCGIPLMLAYIMAHAAGAQQTPAPPKPPVPQAPYPPPAPAPPEAPRVAEGTLGSPPMRSLRSDETLMLVTPQRPFPEPPAARPVSQAPLTEYLRSRTKNGLKGYILGGGFNIGPLEAFFMVGSSLMFGLAHVPGWDIWKLLPTFIAGLGFAYLFLKVGIHAAILLHFSFDYLDLAAGLVPGFDAMLVFLILLWFAVGAFYFAHYAFQAYKWARERLGAPLTGKTA